MRSALYMYMSMSMSMSMSMYMYMYMYIRRPHLQMLCVPPCICIYVGATRVCLCVILRYVLYLLYIHIRVPKVCFWSPIRIFQFNRYGRNDGWQGWHGRFVNLFFTCQLFFHYQVQIDTQTEPASMRSRFSCMYLHTYVLYTHTHIHIGAPRGRGQRQVNPEMARSESYVFTTICLSSKDIQ